VPTLYMYNFTKKKNYI